MREYSSIGIGINYYVYLFFALCFVMIIIQQSNVIPYYYDGNVFSFLIDRDPWTTGILTLLFLSFGINNVIVDNHGITRKVLLLPFFKREKSWKEIKYYAFVNEVYEGQHSETKKAVWFIDYKDYVCFRVTKFGRKNLREILEFVDKVEDKYELYLEFKNPIFMRNGMTKVKYPENTEDEKK